MFILILILLNSLLKDTKNLSVFSGSYPGFFLALFHFDFLLFRGIYLLLSTTLMFNDILNALMIDISDNHLCNVNTTDHHEGSARRDGRISEELLDKYHVCNPRITGASSRCHCCRCLLHMLQKWVKVHIRHFVGKHSRHWIELPFYY